MYDYLFNDLVFLENISFRVLQNIKAWPFSLAGIANPALLVVTLLGNASRSVKSSEKLNKFFVQIGLKKIIIVSKNFFVSKTSET